MKRILTLAAAVALGATALAADWEQQPFTEWPAKQAQKLLERSSWGDVQRIGRPTVQSRIGTNQERPSEGSGVGGSETPPNRPPGSAGGATLGDRQRLYSIKVLARPVRMALARWAMVHNGMSEERAREFVAQGVFQDHIVISVSVPPGQDASELEQETGVLQDSTFLHLKESKKKLLLESFIPPSKSGSGEALFLFPRFDEEGGPSVTLEDKEIRFESRLGIDTRLSQKFKLKKMIFRDKLAL